MISRVMWIFRKNREHISLETLSEYLDGRLSAGKRQVVQRHLETCSECREELGSLEYTVGLLRQAPVITPRRVFTLVGAPPLQPAPHRVRVPAWATGAAASVAVLLFALVTSADLGGLLAGDAPSPELPGGPSGMAALPTSSPQPAAAPAAPEVPTQTKADAIAAEASVDEAGSGPTPSPVAMSREAAGLVAGGYGCGVNVKGRRRGRGRIHGGRVRHCRFDATSADGSGTGANRGYLSPARYRCGRRARARPECGEGYHRDSQHSNSRYRGRSNSGH